MKVYRPTTSSIRFRQSLDHKNLTGKKPEKQLLVSLKKHAGRTATGSVTVRHQGGGHKQIYRLVDFKRRKDGIPAKVAAIEYDPYRNTDLALLFYSDGEKSYILHPLGLAVGDSVLSGEKADVKVGNHLPLRVLPVGTFIHNLEITPGRGGQLVRGAGTMAILTAREENGYVQIRLPSGELRRIRANCSATVGQLGNIDWKNTKLGKAGASRYRGIRPTVRGVAQNPHSHPHGGGEGRSGIGMASPKTPWGKKAMGVRTRRRHHTDKYILARRGGRI